MTVAGRPVDFRDVPAERRDGVAVHRVHSDAPVGGSGLEESVLVLDPGATGGRAVDPARDETLYVMSGSGRATIGGRERDVRPDTALLLTGGATCELRCTTSEPLVVVAVSGRVAREVGCAPGPDVIDLRVRERQDAVSGREFRVLFDPSAGCSGMTQFVGYVPSIRTPRHVHPYSEMLCILRGSGLVEIDGHEERVGAGWCYYLPAGTPHLVQNLGDEPLVELGVFTPAGSPAQNTPVEA